MAEPYQKDDTFVKIFWDFEFSFEMESKPETSQRRLKPLPTGRQVWLQLAVADSFQRGRVGWV